MVVETVTPIPAAYYREAAPVDDERQPIEPSKRFQEIKSYQTEQEQLRYIAEQSIDTLKASQYKAQRPGEISGLLPAAEPGRCHTENAMDDSWTRDMAIAVINLTQPEVLKAFPEGTLLGDDIRNLARGLENGMLELYQRDQWQTKFRDIRIEYIEDQGRIFTHVPAEEYAPFSDGAAVHHQVTGELCSHPVDRNQNPDARTETVPWYSNAQHDAWGFFLIATGQAYQNGIKTDFSDGEIGLIQNISQYLERLEPWHAIGSSMWEGGEVHSPSLLTGSYPAADGLLRVAPLHLGPTSQSMAARVPGRLLRGSGRMIRQGTNHAINQFPMEYTMPTGHYGPDDLAVLVTLAETSLADKVDPDIYFQNADQTLGNSDFGSRRFEGDQYQAVDGEPLEWLMAKIYRVIVRYTQAIKALQENHYFKAEGYAQEAQASFHDVKVVLEQCGYAPELRRADGTISKSNLLWNHVIIIRACALALEYNRLKSDLETTLDQDTRPHLEPMIIYAA